MYFFYLLASYSSIAVLILQAQQHLGGGQFQIEIGKALIGVLAVGLLGVWVKQLLDRLEKEREERSTRRIILRDTFDQLRKYSRQAITKLNNLNLSGQAYFGDLFKPPDRTEEYEYLLDIWERFEPSDTVRRAKVSYQKLQEKFNQNQGSLTKSFRDESKKELQEWLNYYTDRWWGIDIHDSPGPILFSQKKDSSS